MATTIKKQVKSGKSKNGLIKSKKLSWKVLAPIVVLVVAGGVFAVYKSFASVNVVTSTVSFSNKKETGKFISTDGKLCVATRFTDDTGGTAINDSYYWTVQVWDRQGFWANVHGATSQKFQSNGNRDHACYDGQIYKGNTYRVVFYDGNTDLKYTYKGSYYVTGYYRP